MSSHFVLQEKNTFLTGRESIFYHLKSEASQLEDRKGKLKKKRFLLLKAQILDTKNKVPEYTGTHSVLGSNRTGQLLRTYTIETEPRNFDYFSTIFLSLRLTFIAEPTCSIYN